ncbi:MAG: TetR/AcrR family transcriptional regulator [Fastidiosipilaceae bacterium]|nr:TetR/AcrR family transcriptional regulator [Clostridiaceae bacterium]
MEKSTKEKIMTTAIYLFAKYGYAGTTIRMIAKEMNFSEAALYKHFAGKSELFKSIVIREQLRIHDFYKKISVPETIDPINVTAGYQEIQGEALLKMAEGIFNFFTKDEEISLYRKILTREQYGNSDIAEIYDKKFLSGVIESQSKIFEKFIADGYFSGKLGNSKLIATRFYSPIFLLFQIYDIHPHRENEILQILREHVDSFGVMHGLKK